jgi:type II secretory pathway pseudopilin PulG
MIEMLTVIAIIAILAGFLFPVYSGVKSRSRETACISNLHQVFLSLHQYKLDEADYPPAIFGYVSQDGPHLFAATTAKTQTAGELKCPDNPEAEPQATYQLSALQPNVDLNRAKQSALDPIAKNGQFLGVNSYDGQFAGNPDQAGGTYELHYSRFRPTKGPSDPDYTRQLSNRQCPGNTVITWCAYHVKTRKEIVFLFEGGTAEAIPAQRVNAEPWRTHPKSD